LFVVGHDVGFRTLGDDTPEAIRRLVGVLGPRAIRRCPASSETTPRPANVSPLLCSTATRPTSATTLSSGSTVYPSLFRVGGHWPHHHRPTDTPDRWRSTILTHRCAVKLPPMICCLFQGVPVFSTCSEVERAFMRMNEGHLSEQLFWRWVNLCEQKWISLSERHRPGPTKLRQARGADHRADGFTAKARRGRIPVVSFRRSHC
jgi:hypothetical protein